MLKNSLIDLFNRVELGLIVSVRNETLINFEMFEVKLRMLDFFFVRL